MNNEDILENWNNYLKCPDFTPLLTSLLTYKTKLEADNKILKECVELAIGIIDDSEYDVIDLDTFDNWVEFSRQTLAKINGEEK